MDANPPPAESDPLRPHPLLERYYSGEAGRRRQVDEWFDEAAPDYNWINQVLSFGFSYDDDDSIEEKICKVATKVYGAKDVIFYLDAQKKIRQYNDDGLDKLPICMAKTHLSLSADPTLLNAPENFEFPVRDIRAYTGAGWLVPLAGDIQQMPGLGKTPAALNVDIDAEGRTVGLF